MERALVNSAAVFRSPHEREDYPYLTAVGKREPLTRRAWDGYLLPLASEEDMPARWSDRDGGSSARSFVATPDTIAAEGAATTASLARGASLSTY